MFTFKQTEKVETGLDVLVIKEGKAYCWCYDLDSASNICDALNKIGSLEDTLSLIKQHSSDEWVTQKADEVLE